MTHPRRQQYRHLAGSAGYAVAAAAVLLVAVSVWRSGGEPLLLFTFLLLATGLSFAARHSRQLAGRCRVGADSERAVQLVLKQLARSGWTVRSGVGWAGGGDVDHLVRSPDGLGFAIETKTMTFSQAHLRRTEATARWAAQRRRSYPHGVIPVLCVVRARRVESRCGQVVVASLDRLLPVLEHLALSTRHGGLAPGRHRSSKRQTQSSDRVRLGRARSGVSGEHDG